MRNVVYIILYTHLILLKQVPTRYLELRWWSNKTEKIKKKSLLFEEKEKRPSGSYIRITYKPYLYNIITNRKCPPKYVLSSPDHNIIYNNMLLI